MRVGAVVRTDVLFHYGLRYDFDPVPVVHRGILPLSVVDPAAARARLDGLRALYELFAASVLGPGDGRHTGIFLTPIDFRAMRDDSPAIAWIQGFGRFAIPLTAIAPGAAVLTWEGPFLRTALVLSAAALERAADTWSPELVRQWFGRDRFRMFFHVPQVVTFQDTIPVSPAQWEPPGSDHDGAGHPPAGRSEADGGGAGSGSDAARAAIRGAAAGSDGR